MVWILCEKGMYIYFGVMILLSWECLRLGAKNIQSREIIKEIKRKEENLTRSIEEGMARTVRDFCNLHTHLQYMVNERTTVLAYILVGISMVKLKCKIYFSLSVLSPHNRTIFMA